MNNKKNAKPALAEDGKGPEADETKDRGLSPIETVYSAVYDLKGATAMLRDAVLDSIPVKRESDHAYGIVNLMLFRFHALEAELLKMMEAM